jgi:hypothetical protein
MLALVSIGTLVFDAPEPAASPAARFTPLGRIGAAATLVLGAGCQLVAFALERSPDDAADRLAWVAAHAERAEAAKLFDVLAMPFLLGAPVVYVLLGRERSPRLAWAGGILLAFGLTGLTVVQGYETHLFSLALDGGFDLGALADRAEDLATAPEVAMLAMFIPGALLGLSLTTASLWRSRAVPRGAVVLLPAFIVVDGFLAMGLTAHAIAFVGACWIAWAVLDSSRPRV